MNCVEFRRQLGVDPQSNAAEFARHRAECPRCAEAAGRAGEFERGLARALNVDVPPQLADSILLAQATVERRRRTSLRRGGIFALAASLALAVGLVGMRAEAKSLPALAVEHMLGEEVAALKTTTTVSDDAVIAAFAKRGIALHRVPAGVGYVAPCPVGKYRTVHMVMPGADGPTTVIYAVNSSSAARENFQRDGWQGRSVPIGDGTLIILAQKSTGFDHVESEWRSALADATRS